MTYRKEDGYNSLLATRIRAIMDKRNIKQKELSEKTGISRQRIGYYSDGKNVPDAETLAKIAQALDVSSDYLLGLANDEKPKQNDLSLVTYADFINAMEKLMEVSDESSFSVFDENDDSFDPEFHEPYVEFRFYDKALVKYYQEMVRMISFFDNAPDVIKETAKEYQLRIKRDLLNEAENIFFEKNLPF